MYRNPGDFRPKSPRIMVQKNVKKIEKIEKRKIVKKRYLTLNVTLVAPLQKKVVARSYMARRSIAMPV